MAAELALKTSEFEDKVLNSQIPVLIDFWAEWCGPCRLIAPAVEEVAREFAGQAAVYKVNVDQEPELAEKFGIMSIPSILVFKGGQKVGQIIGAVPKAKIVELIKSQI